MEYKYFQLQRKIDGLVYEFDLKERWDSVRWYCRRDQDLWIRYRSDLWWVAYDEINNEVQWIPWNTPIDKQISQHPPEGIWVSRKWDKSYVYDLVYASENNIKNAEFKNERLAQIYENFNQFSDDEDFWLNTIWGLGVEDITDFGCGTGLFTGKLSELGYSLRWIEPALPMIEQAKEKDSDNKITYIHWGYEELQGFSTDLVLMTSHVSQFIINTDEWNTLLSNAYEVLSTWWYILFDSKNSLLKPWENYIRENYNRTKDTKFWPVNMQIEVSKVKWNVITHDIHYTFLDTQEELISSNTLIYKTKEEIQQSLLANGFRIIKVYGDWKGKEYKDTNSEMIFLVQKK
jgi:SAM-dependent methyltransferase